MKYIELFAGCGGLSLGLESCSFELLFANELSPMAGETFAYNLLNEDLGTSIDSESSRVKWISSNYSRNQMSKRLRENPQTFPKYTTEVSDLPRSLEGIQGNLLIGNIIELNRYLQQNDSLLSDIQKRDVDLVSGGPPCQSFSMAGLRQIDNKRNSLPMDFAQFVHLSRPKIAVLENVSGILRAFNVGDEKYYAWFEVARAFASKNYYPICLHVNAKYVGAAQNRPRFILIALREDIFNRLETKDLTPTVRDVMRQTSSFVTMEKNKDKTSPFVDLNYYDVDLSNEVFTDDIFCPLFQYTTEDKWFTVKDSIDDLKTKGIKTSEYSSMLTKIFPAPKHKGKSSLVPNHDNRGNSQRVKMRFMLYQHLSDLKTSKDTKFSSKIEKDVTQFLKNPETHKLNSDSIQFLIGRHYLSSDGESKIRFSSEDDLLSYLRVLQTKKQTQRALIPTKPAPAALSIPDDACHYDKNLQRTLTVREMARFQSFPDWFEFRSKVTTGGKMRQFEVPQYTQVGNAVPPLLGKALGETVLKILRLTQ